MTGAIMALLLKKSKLFNTNEIVWIVPKIKLDNDLRTTFYNQESIELLKRLNVFNYFEYVAGSDTFNYNKPDPRHLTDVIEIVGGDLKKTIMVGDSEVDEMAASNAKLPFILVADGYTEKTSKQIKHDALIKDYVGFDKIISKYLW